jgi:hypothetical protein
MRISAVLAAGLAAASVFPAVERQPSPAATNTPQPDVVAAAAYAVSRGVSAGVAVLDIADGTSWLAGAHSRTFSSASVVKVMIAARLLVTGQMRGDVAEQAERMITRSDDAAANALYASVGGDRLIDWVKDRYSLPFLGRRPDPPGRWGNTRVTPRGIVHLYRELSADPKVAPWLRDTMGRATRYGSDGQFQYFGIPAAANDFAIKQGWTCCDGGVATFASTGFVENGRYAVALFVDGPPHTYGDRLIRVLDGMARLLFADGTIDPGDRPTPRRERCGATR